MTADPHTVKLLADLVERLGFAQELAAELERRRAGSRRAGATQAEPEADNGPWGSPTEFWNHNGALAEHRVERFVAECVTLRKGARLRGRELHEAFLAWQGDRDPAPMPFPSFERHLGLALHVHELFDGVGHDPAGPRRGRAAIWLGLVLDGSGQPPTLPETPDAHDAWDRLRRRPPRGH